MMLELSGSGFSLSKVRSIALPSIALDELAGEKCASARIT